MEKREKFLKKNLDIIAATPLFNGLDADALQTIREIALCRDYEKGLTIFSEGDPGDGFYIVADGCIKIYKLSAEGKEQILHIFGAGEPFGEVPVFSGKPFPANAQAIRRSRLLFFPKSAFIAAIVKNPSLALSMLGVLSLRLREFTVQIENLSLKEVPGRLSSYLLYLSEEQKNPHSVRLGISKSQLASLLGTIPETLSRMLARMAASRLICVQGNDIRLLNREELQNLSEGGKLA